MSYVKADPLPPQFEDVNGDPLVLGTIEFYIWNTSTPTPVYFNSAGSAFATSVTLNLLGQPSNGGDAVDLFYDNAVVYKIIRKDAAGTEISPVLGPFAAAMTAADLGNSSNPALGASLIGFDGGTLPDFFRSKNERVIESIALLRALDKTKYTRVFVTGYYAAGDGGGGHYWYDPADTTTADDGGMVIVASDGARWKLVLQKRVSVKQFGAKGDGVFNDRPAFSAAVAAALAIYVPTGQYLFGDNTTVSCRYGQDILGESSHSTLRPNSGLVVLSEGSIILITSTTVPPFTYYSSNKFKGLTFYYPEQLRTQVTPTTYPPTFKWNAAGISEVFVNCGWYECQFVNSYIWIDALQGHLDYEFYDIVGCPIYRGIRTDGCGGTDIFRGIRGSYYYWCQFADAVQTWIGANATGIELGRSDAFHMDRIYFGSLNAGIRFFKGTVNDLRGPYGSITGLSLDGNNYGIYSEATSVVGVNIVDMMSNSRVVDIEYASAGADPSYIQITGFKLWGSHINGARVNRASCKLKLADGEIYTCTNAGVLVGAASGDITLSKVSFDDMGGVSSLTTTAQCNVLMLTANQFNQAPTLFGTPATIHRFRGNLFLADGSVGA